MKKINKLVLVAAVFASAVQAMAQNYPPGLIDKTVAVVGNEMISLSEIEEEIQYMRANGVYSDKRMRCTIIESALESKLFLMQARIDSLTVNNEYVGQMLNSRVDEIRHALGGDEQVEEYFGKPMYKLRNEWQKTLEDQSLTMQMQQNIASEVPELTPLDVKEYVESLDPEDVPEVPIKYELSQICLYPDRETAAMAVKERLLALRERIINGEKFTTLARIYSEDPGSAIKGGELGMTPKSSFWPEFSDAAMSLKPGVISQIVETPDGFHIIEVIEKKGDMFNARHILMKPVYTSDDRDKAFKTLDSLRTELQNEAVTFQLAARFYSQDPSSRTNGGQMADPNSGSAYFEIDQIYPPADYTAIKNLKVGEISEPFESLDREGRGNTVYKIIKVDNITPAHPATFENDYSEFMDAAQSKLMQEAIDKFLEEKIASTKIYIDPIFRDCDFARESWAELASKQED